jgi:hypothetical protein
MVVSKLMPCVTDPVLQQADNETVEKRLLSIFTNNLSDTPGRQVRLTRPATADDALYITENTIQVEAQEACNKAFYTDSCVADITPAG